jgi:hypothetical protein
MKIHEIIKNQGKSVSLGLIERIQEETPFTAMNQAETVIDILGSLSLGQHQVV